MEKARQLLKEEVQASPPLRDLIEKAKAGGESIITYEGVTILCRPLEDITHTFIAEERKEFIADYLAADEDEPLSVEEAMARFGGLPKRHG